MSRTDTALLVIDVQERLVPAIRDWRRVVWNCGRLIDGAGILGVPVVGTEQYPKGLGSTVPGLAERLGGCSTKLTFSCRECAAAFQPFLNANRNKLLVCGMETHVCVQQTVYDLLDAGWHVYVAMDAVGSRTELDERVAIARMAAAGAVLTTTEAALFEWCERAGTAEFKQISQLVRPTEPPVAG
ncbi:MAG: isochorismatase family protein [Patescibacteria group bacterium]|nr:isochorismatase family protein [Patescibacteria group bacterium]